ncbi:MAG TPA: dienelactone hydrolase family protein, partial [Thermoanaerobaculia bacterium]|nr:dienelactone hydrolase family protein [Thermoanaerobaculia bacterium]
MGERVQFPSNRHTCSGYFAGQGPGVVVIQEWWGLVPHIEDLVERFAGAGFAAIAPDLYHGK